MSAVLQSAFAASLEDPARPAPEQLAPSGDTRPERRFAVYRNNVAVSLAGAIAKRFPAVQRIVGDEFFAELARAYVAGHRPRSPVMMSYGDDFPDFVALAPGLDELPYLADVARLEAARTRAYHAADAEPLGAEAFAALDPEALDRAALTLHPSVETVRSARPVVTIWAMNAGETELGPIEDWRGEDALVARPGMDVLVRALPPGGAAFLGALKSGAPLGAAAAIAADDVQDFDLTQNLIGLIEAGLAVGLGSADPTGDAS
ncbi:DNA-binding domain-containing protein [Methylopila sp. M107]|uniref:HvfC/BufC N-terminal domain-containing protein n=1 Tax=Methylopila sp. M107 TaxID=1101190 RepID=UPI00037D0C31|nr:DNA-binding domain-containing protein [Methylopila sp. M107]